MGLQRTVLITALALLSSVPPTPGSSLEARK